MKTLFIGTQKDTDGHALNPIAVSRALLEIKREAARIFGGYSASIVQGGWLNEKGQLIEEDALRLELSPREEISFKVYDFAAWCGNLLNQSCVLLVSNVASQSYVDASPLVKIESIAA
jgi:hypothetical protein